MECKYCVYKHTSPSRKVYIGITLQEAKRRWQDGKGYKKSPHFYSAIEKYGWDNFEHEILISGLTKEEAEKEEKRLISFYNSADKDFGYNMTFGGETGVKITDEVKKKISDRLTEYYKNHPEARERMSKSNIGKHHSEETKKKMSETHKKQMTDDFRKKMGDSRRGIKYPNRKGHPQSEETREKIREKKRGKHFGGKGRKPTPVLCVDTGVVYKSAVEAHKQTGVGFGNIYRVCNDKRGTAGGYKWQYAVEYNSDRETA